MYNVVCKRKFAYAHDFDSMSRHSSAMRCDLHYIALLRVLCDCLRLHFAWNKSEQTMWCISGTNDLKSPYGHFNIWWQRPGTFFLFIIIILLSFFVFCFVCLRSSWMEDNRSCTQLFCVKHYGRLGVLRHLVKYWSSYVIRRCLYL